ncbi:MAG: 50S ribosomal protein L17 [SAR324 cluster bacterium]|nr:50S ribosomal protein L17 [SAR324 cluster bacterium]
MRHRKAFRRLGVNKGQRKALLKSLATQLAERGEISTTLARAKELKRAFDKLITLGKKSSLHARRLAYRRLNSSKSVIKIFDEYAPKFKNRLGGYTRIYKLANRLGDNSLMAKITLAEYDDYQPEKEDKKELPIKDTEKEKKSS